MTTAYQAQVRKHEEKISLGKHIDGRIVEKWILKKQKIRQDKQDIK